MRLAQTGIPHLANIVLQDPQFMQFVGVQFTPLASHEQ